ncbi:MAG: hypothetical protein ACK4UJ_00725 [Leptonema sp. (in: bacteria)]
MLEKDKILKILMDHSPLIKEHKEELEIYWDQALQLLKFEDKEKLLNYYKNYSPKNIKEFIFYFYFLFSGCFYLLIQYDQKKYLEFGYPIHLLDSPLLKRNLFIWRKLHILAIYPYKSELYIQKIFLKEFFPLIRKMILNDTEINNSNSYDYLENSIEYIEKKSKSYLEKNIPVTLSHFKFENLENYIYYLNNSGIYNFVLELEKFIHSKLKKRDLLIILSYNSFLVMSIGVKKEQIYERFKNIYIEINNLVLDYHFYIETLYSIHDPIREIFYKLKI